VTFRLGVGSTAVHVRKATLFCSEHLVLGAGESFLIGWDNAPDAVAFGLNDLLSLECRERRGYKRVGVVPPLVSQEGDDLVDVGGTFEQAKRLKCGVLAVEDDRPEFFFLSGPRRPSPTAGMWCKAHLQRPERTIA
jgi:hypothetical protein